MMNLKFAFEINWPVMKIPSDFFQFYNFCNLSSFIPAHKKILTEIWHQFWDKNAGEIIFRFHEPFQSYQLTGPAKPAFLADFFYYLAPDTHIAKSTLVSQKSLKWLTRDHITCELAKIKVTWPCHCGFITNFLVNIANF